MKECKHYNECPYRADIEICTSELQKTCPILHECCDLVLQRSK